MEPRTGSWQGTCGFRLTPDDELQVAPSRATTEAEAAGTGWSLRYTWVHPQDGEQAGLLVLGGAGEDGSVTAAWIDSWHQRPEVRLLTGTTDGVGTHLETDYDGWLWRVGLTAGPGTLAMTMHNVVPDGVDGAGGGPYLAMDAVWSSTPG